MLATTTGGGESSLWSVRGAGEGGGAGAGWREIEPVRSSMLRSSAAIRVVSRSRSAVSNRTASARRLVSPSGSFARAMSSAAVVIRGGSGAALVSDGSLASDLGIVVVATLECRAPILALAANTATTTARTAPRPHAPSRIIAGMSKCSSNFEFNSPGTLLIIPDHPRTPPQPHLQAANQPLENVNRIPPIRLQAGYYLKGGPGLSRACVAGYEGNSRPRGASIQSVRRYER
jgi:hypothetical protein